MKISFVVPAYNEEAVVAESLHAILRELQRTPTDAEVVLVNNASTDKTKEIALTIEGVRVIDELHKGLVRARHAGYVATTGELVANIDSDTLIPPGWLGKVLKEFEKDKNLVALSGPYIYHDLSWSHRAMVKVFYFFGYLSYLFNHYILRKGAMLQGGNFVLRRSAWDKAGGFDTTIDFYGEDTDVARRLAPFGHIKWTWGLPAYTSGRRLKHEGIIQTGLRYAANYLCVLTTGRPFTKHYKDVRPKS